MNTRRIARYTIGVLTLVAAGQISVGGDAAADQHQDQRAWAEHVAWARYAGVATSGYTASLDDQATAIKAMIEHHQDAIGGSRIYLEHGSDPIVRDFAERLIRTQTEQVAEMEAWLTSHPDATPASDVQWTAMCGDADATGTDIGYLANMIDHHQAAVDMYRVMVAHGDIEDDEIGRMMRRIGLGQIGEIEWMRQQIAALNV